jgi:spermidine/putrescine transport system substrate-binding protein
MNMPAKISRRLLLGLAAQAAAVAMLPGCSHRSARESANELHLYSWADYLHPDAIAEFEKRHGLRVIYDTYASNEALLAKMQAGASNYDVIVPTSYMVKNLKKLGLIQKLDKQRLPNFKYIMPRFQNTAFDPHSEYAIAYTWGTTGIGYNQAAFKGRTLPDDWDVFWDERLLRRITLLDDARETLGMALKRRGHSYNTTDEHMILQARNDLIAQKRLVMSYTSDQVILQLASGDCLASLVFSGDAFQAARENPDVRYVIPRSGASIWTDNLCIPKNAPNVKNAYLWLNYMMEPAVAAATANYTRYATPNADALKMIEPELLNDKNLYPTEQVMDKCEQVGDVGQTIFVYDRMWTELKCA